MSSFGGVPIDVKGLGIDFLVSSANKCIQGVPGFGFILAQKDKLMATKGNARSLSLDIYAQWEAMEKGGRQMAFHVSDARGSRFLPSDEGIERGRRYHGSL